jgi:hypothetical protein
MSESARAPTPVVVVGQIAGDLVLRVESVPGAGGSSSVLLRHELLGGKGANQAAGPTCHFSEFATWLRRCECVGFDGAALRRFCLYRLRYRVALSGVLLTCAIHRLGSTNGSRRSATIGASISLNTPCISPRCTAQTTS